MWNPLHPRSISGGDGDQEKIQSLSRPDTSLCTTKVVFSAEGSSGGGK